MLLVVGLVASGLWALYRLKSLVLLLTMAALFAYIVAPLVHLVERPVRLAGRRRQLPRGLAIAVVYLALGGCVTIAAVLLLPIASEQAHDMIARAPSYAQSIAAWEHGWSREYERLRIPVGLRHSIDESMTSMGEAAFESTRATIVALVVAVLPWMILIPVLAFFLLKDASALRRLVVTGVTAPRSIARPPAVRRSQRDARGVHARAIARVSPGRERLRALGSRRSAFRTPCCSASWPGPSSSFLWSDPLVVAVAATIVGALHAPLLAVWALTFLGLVRIVEDYVVFPRLMRRGVRLHPLAVIVAVLAGAALGGIVGMFLAVPIAAVASVLGRHLIGWHSDEATPEPESSRLCCSGQRDSAGPPIVRA